MVKIKLKKDKEKIALKAIKMLKDAGFSISKTLDFDHECEERYFVGDPIPQKHFTFFLSFTMHIPDEFLQEKKQ